MLKPQDIQRDFQHCLHSFQHLTLNRISANASNKEKKKLLSQIKTNVTHDHKHTHFLKITSLKIFTNPFLSLSRCIPGHHHPARHEVLLVLLTRIPRSNPPPNPRQTILNWCKTWKSSSSCCTKTMHITVLIIACSPAASVQWRNGKTGWQTYGGGGGCVWEDWPK